MWSLLIFWSATLGCIFSHVTGIVDFNSCLFIGSWELSVFQSWRVPIDFLVEQSKVKLRVRWHTVSAPWLALYITHLSENLHISTAWIRFPNDFWMKLSKSRSQCFNTKRGSDLLSLSPTCLKAFTYQLQKWCSLLILESNGQTVKDQVHRFDIRQWFLHNFLFPILPTCQKTYT